MARINTYVIDTTINADDKWIGTDIVTGRTRNFTARGISEFIAKSRTYTFTQSIAAQVWTIEHNLERYPSITVVDSSGNVVVGFETYNSDKTITLTFSAPFSGNVYLN